ncbi:hypothetical protein [Oryzobacter telluris]|uniref:hypothetical protein n=1 Tax=Oryzobacter telluris TaxID=3149179 RepID=UPI00370D7CBD
MSATPGSPLPETTPRVPRRSIARGAVWAVPVIVVGAAAPMVSASTTDCPTIPLYGDPAWAIDEVGRMSGDAARFLGTDFVVTGQGTSFYTAVAYTTIDVVAGRVYTFAYTVTVDPASAGPGTRGNISYLGFDGQNQGDSSVNTSDGILYRTVTFAVTANTTGPTNLEFVSTVYPGSNPAHDVTFSSITLTCGPPPV